MIIWCGTCKNIAAYRTLGSTQSGSTTLIRMPAIRSGTMDIAHSEGTTLRQGTTPCIGSGKGKLLRDYACKGITVGKTLSEPDVEPILLKRSMCHVMAYDIETEFHGKEHPYFKGRILCISLVCSCGYQHTLSMCEVFGVPGEVTVCKDNAEMCIRAIDIIIKHAPIFTVGHNIYTFDNVVIATALPPDHEFRKMFEPTYHTIKGFGNMGLVMCIPGINNFDTYRYITKAMPQGFRAFSLANIADELGIEEGKTSTQGFQFSPHWYSRSHSNAAKMCNYNIRDCRVCLDICWKLDLFNQIINMCYATNCSIEDALIYSTGAISSTTLCSKAHEMGLKFIWTRCDWHPQNFKGGLVWFRGPIACPLTCIIDFGSMYPNIMKCSGISPESVDFYDLNPIPSIRFHNLEVHVYYEFFNSGEIHLGMTMFGRRIASENKCVFVAQIANCCYKIDCKSEPLKEITQSLSSKVTKVVKEWLKKEQTLKKLRVRIVDISPAKIHLVNGIENSNPEVLPKMYPFAEEMCSYIYKTYYRMLETTLKGTVYPDYSDFNQIWIPQDYKQHEGSVDWIVSPLGTDVVVVVGESVIRHPVGLNLAAGVCNTLIKERKKVRLRRAELLKVDSVEARDAANVKDKVQWALKIAANSLYGSFSFPSYNTYSPRCGTSVTCIGRWGITVTACIVKSLGCIPLYGDTDSVMFTIPLCCPKKYITSSIHQRVNHRDIAPDRGNSLLPGLVKSMRPLVSNKETRRIVIELMCGNDISYEFLERYVRHVKPFESIVTKIVNYILSFTHLSTLKMDVEPAMDGQYQVYENFAVLSAKHYIAARDDGSHMSKGVSYVRRVGNVIGNNALKKFADIILSKDLLNTKKRNMGIVYQSLKCRLTSRDNLEIYGVTNTVHGITRDVVMVKYSGEKPKFVSMNNASVNDVHLDYYYKILEDVYERIWVTIGMSKSTIKDDMLFLATL